METDTGEREFRGLLDRLPVALVMLDRQGRIRYFNPTAERLAKQTRLEVGQALWDVAPVEVAHALRGVFQRLLGGEQAVVLRYYFAAGRWYEVVGYPAGQEITLLANDITERLEAEALRQQTEQRFRILLKSIKDYAIILLDPEQLIASWNEGAERMFGYRAAEVLGKDPTMFYPPEDGHQLRENLEAAVASGEREDHGWRLRKGGSRLFVNVFYYPLYDELRQPSGFSIVVKDITESRRIEERLRSSEERLRLALDAAELGTFEYQIATNQLRADVRALGFLGLPPRSEPYRREDVLARVAPVDRDQVSRAQDEAMAGASYEDEYRVLESTTSSERWLEGRGKALLDQTGKPIRVVGVIRDVTARHRFDEFRKLLPGLIAHDLRSPITTIALASEAMELGDGAGTRYPKMIHRCAEAMARMAEQLLDFSQAHFGGGIPCQRAPADLADISNEAVMAARVRAPDVDFDFHVEGDAWGEWDRTRILEVVDNLLSNAIKHGSRGQPIDVTVRSDGDDVVLAVHNGGAPIPAELVPVLFDPFRRAARSDHRHGELKSHGLGLYIVREIVVSHGGTIDVSSTSEAGTTFTVRLPRGTRATTSPAPEPARPN